MKSIVLAAAIAAAIASPALAKSADAMHHTRQSHHVMSTHAALNAADPYGAYVDGREIGRDPDPNIRSSLQDEYYEMQGGGE